MVHHFTSFTIALDQPEVGFQMCRVLLGFRFKWLHQRDNSSVTIKSVTIISVSDHNFYSCVSHHPSWWSAVWHITNDWVGCIAEKRIVIRYIFWIVSNTSRWHHISLVALSMWARSGSESSDIHSYINCVQSEDEQKFGADFIHQFPLLWKGFGPNRNILAH